MTTPAARLYEALQDPARDVGPEEVVEIVLDLLEVHHAPGEAAFVIEAVHRAFVEGRPFPGQLPLPGEVQEDPVSREVRRLEGEDIGPNPVVGPAYEAPVVPLPARPVRPAPQLKDVTARPARPRLPDGLGQANAQESST